ncbi:MAG TPA: ABC transporter permease, partial [Vicinamibacterales bacterium]
MRAEHGFRVLPLRLRSLFRRARAERDLDDEISYHVEIEVERYTSAGMDSESARRLVMRSFGNVQSVKEGCRDARGTRLIETIAADVRYGVRTLLRAPAFTAVAVVTLALGIGINSAVFSLADGLLLAPLPYAAADQLVSVTATYPGGAFAALRGEVSELAVAAYAEGHSFILTGAGEPVRVPGTLVSVELLPLLGIKPELGRWPREGEDVAPRDRIVILSHALWAARFQADPAILGRFVDVDGVRREIVAVMPPTFCFPSRRTEIWVPLGLDARDTKRTWAGDFMPVVGRLRPGANMARAVDEVRAFQRRVPALFPWPMPADWNHDVGVIPLRDAIVGSVRTRVLILIAAVGVVLVIACANVANLSLSRAVAREREIAIRAAIGASPARIARQLFTESVVLAAAGAVAGWLVAALAISLLRRVLPPDTPRLDEVALSSRALLASGALAVVTGCAFGCAPVVHALRLGLRKALESGGRGASEDAGRVRAALAIAQVGCAVLLVIAAGLLVRSLWSLSHVDGGFRSSDIVVARITPAESVCAAPDPCLAFYRKLEATLRGSNGVQRAALINTLPLTGAVAKRSVDLEGYAVPPSKPGPLFWLNVVTPDYFRVMDIRIDTGRSFTPADLTGHPATVIVSASTAKRYWPGENPVGRHVRFDGDADWRTIVGVAGDVHAYD